METAGYEKWRELTTPLYDGLQPESPEAANVNIQIAEKALQDIVKRYGKTNVLRQLNDMGTRTPSGEASTALDNAVNKGVSDNLRVIHDYVRSL